MTKSWQQFNPQLPATQLSRMLSAFPRESIWRWLLECQDEQIFPPEVKEFKNIKALAGHKTLLNLAWGNDQLLVPRKQDFENCETREIGLSLDYLFQGNAKARSILKDIGTLLKNEKFDIIRLHLVAQMVQHHGLLLEGLKKYLNDNGALLIIDAFDELNARDPELPTFAMMYKELNGAQKETGGNRSAALRMEKRASVFGYRLIHAASIGARTLTEVQRQAQFACFCFQVQIIAPLFGEKYDRLKMLNEAKAWYETPGSWSQFGFKMVAVRAVKARAKKRIRRKF